MGQNADNVLDHANLFREPEYLEMLGRKKREFENPSGSDEVEKIREWTKTPEYREKNFAREALTVNPAKACQPLGAVFAPSASKAHCRSCTVRKGCVAYYRRTSPATSRSRHPASRRP